MQTRKSDQPKARTKRKTAKKSKPKTGMAWRNYEKSRHKKAAAEAKKRQLNRPPEFNEKQSERDAIEKALAAYIAAGGVMTIAPPAHLLAGPMV